MSYIFYFLISLLSSLILIQLFKFGFLNKVTNKTLHLKRIGGLIIIFNFILFLSLSYFFGNEFGIIPKDFWSIIACSFLIIVFGYLDDKYSLPPFVQLLVHTLIAAVFIFSGDFINYIDLPGVGTISFPLIFKIIFTFGWFLLVINAFNWFDGMDGLAGGVGFITFMTIFFLSLSSIVNQPNTAFISLIIAASVLGFLYFNFFPAQIYLGSMGSWYLGSMIAVLSIYSGGKVATAALVLGIPIMDFFYVLITRTKEKKKPWRGGDRKHLHFKLEDSGLSKKRIILFMYAASLSLGALALTLQADFKIIALFFLAVAFVFFTLKYRT